MAGLPLYLFRVPTGNILTSVPQPGPLGGVFARPELDAAGRERAYAALLGRALELAREKDCVALTVITNPFSPDLELTRRCLAPVLELENFTQFIRVTPGPEDPMPFEVQRRTNLSRNLKKAVEAGLTSASCASEAEFEIWYAIHAARHREIGAVPLSRELLANLLKCLRPANKCELLLVKRGEELAAGTLFVWHRRVTDAFIMSMDSRFSAVAPNHISTRDELLAARARSGAVFNWQGSPSRESGVYVFKKQLWMSEERPYSFVTRLLVPPERVRAIGLEETKQRYASHYLVPFGFFEDGNPEGRYVRA
ncbi:MAG: GNAT family N-acetyltransferase [bacterium]